MSGINRMAIRRGAVQSLTLRPFPDTLRLRDPKLGSELEAWRRDAETTLFESISALKLDTDSAASGDVSDAIKAYVTGLMNTLSADAANRVLRSGDTMLGPLYGSRLPQQNMEFAVKYYVDQLVIGDNALFVKIAGSTMTGYLTLNADPVNPLHAATRQFVLAQIAANVSYEADFLSPVNPWVVVHPLGRIPATTALDSSGEEISPWVFPTSTIVTVQHNGARTGKVVLT